MQPKGDASHLAARAIAVFASRPEVRKIVQFGSLGRRTADQYSDVDLEIVTDKSARTIGDIPALVERIDEPFVIFAVRELAEQAAYTVLFRHYSFYQRLDIGISSQDIVTAADFSSRHLLVDAAGMHVVYCRSHDDLASFEGPSCVCGSAASVSSSPSPVRTLYETFLGALRYVKYRKRQKELAAYKFYRAIQSDFLLDTYRHLWPESQKTSLGLMDYLTLERIGHEDYARYLYPGDEREMNIQVIEMLSMILLHATSGLDTHHREALSTIIQFVAQELNGKESILSGILD